MDLLFLIARVVHVGLGVFWAGTLIFNAALLYPALVEAGPEGAKVAAGLLRRKFPVIVPAAAILTILSGLYLYWRDSMGFGSAFARTPISMTYGLGAVAAVVAFALGVGVMRPAMLKAAALSEAAPGTTPEERDRMLAAAQALRARAGSAGQVVAWLLGATTLAMAIARYV